MDHGDSILFDPMVKWFFQGLLGFLPLALVPCPSLNFPLAV